MQDSVPRPGLCGVIELQATLRDFLEQTSGCALCALLARLAYKHIVHFGTTDLDNGEHPSDRIGMGLCNWHLWELDHSFESPQFAGKLLKMLTLLPRDLGLGTTDTAALEELPLSRRRCSVCQELADDAAGYVEQLANLLTGATYRDIYEKSFGLCFPHLHAVARAATPETRAWLFRAEGAHWLRLKYELSELQRKWNPELRGEVTRREATSPRRCVEKLVGGPGWLWPSESAAR